MPKDFEQTEHLNEWDQRNAERLLAKRTPEAETLQRMQHPSE